MMYEDIRCPVCNGSMTVEVTVEHITEKAGVDPNDDFGITEYEFDAPVFTCSACGHEWTDAEKEVAATHARLLASEKRLFDLRRAQRGQQIIQYRDDLVRCFVDTEFYEDGSTIDLISLGAVRSDGHEFYAVSSDAKLDRVSDWVREHVVSQLPPKESPLWQPRAQIAEGFSRFMQGSALDVEQRPVGETWAYYADYDWVAICQLYGTMMGLPKHFPMYCLDLKQLSWMLGNPRHPEQENGEHNALEDARWNRDLFAYLRTVPSGVRRFGR